MSADDHDIIDVGKDYMSKKNTHYLITDLWSQKNNKQYHAKITPCDTCGVEVYYEFPYMEYPPELGHNIRREWVEGEFPGKEHPYPCTRIKGEEPKPKKGASKPSSAPPPSAKPAPTSAPITPSEVLTPAASDAALTQNQWNSAFLVLLNRLITNTDTTNDELQQIKQILAKGAK